MAAWEGCGKHETELQGMTMNFKAVFLAVVSGLLCAGPISAVDWQLQVDGWQATAPREELHPHFASSREGGPSGRGSLLITHDDREGLDGWFEKSFPVQGGEWYRFQCVRQTTAVAEARRSTLVRILWQDEAGKGVHLDVPSEHQHELGAIPWLNPNIHTTAQRMLKAGRAWKKSYMLLPQPRER